MNAKSKHALVTGAAGFIGSHVAQSCLARGMTVTAALGGANVINFQPTGTGKAAITGDFLVTSDEVNPLIRALRAGGIEVTAIHSHMLGEQPRLFLIHFWANDDAQKLARGLRAALEKTAIAKP